MCSLKRVIFKVPQKLQKNNLVGVPFLIKMQVSGLQLTTITQLLAQIIQRSTKHSAYSKSCANHSTLLKSIQHCNYKSFDVVRIIQSFKVLKIVKLFCGIYKHQSTVENQYSVHQ